MAADGSIIIDTKINTDGIHAGENKLKSSMKKLEASINGLGEQSKASLQKQMLSLSRLADRYDQQARKVESLKQKLSELSKQKRDIESYLNKPLIQALQEHGYDDVIEMYNREAKKKRKPEL